MKEKEISRLLMQVGCGLTYKGFKYLRDIIDMAFQDEKVIYNLSENAYPKISEKYNTKAETVERDIRTMIEACWNDDPTEIKKISLQPLKYRPSTKQFLSVLIGHMMFNANN